MEKHLLPLYYYVTSLPQYSLFSVYLCATYISVDIKLQGGLGAFESDAIEKGEIRRSGLSFLKNRFSLV